MVEGYMLDKVLDKIKMLENILVSEKDLSDINFEKLKKCIGVHKK